MPCFVLNAATDPESHPQTELYWGHVNPIGPRACYDEAKRVAETMCYAYQKQVVELIRLLVTNRWNWRLSAHLCINFACHSLSKRSNVPVFKIFDIAFFKGRPSGSKDSGGETVHANLTLRIALPHTCTHCREAFSDQLAFDF